MSIFVKYSNFVIKILAVFFQKNLMTKRIINFDELQDPQTIKPNIPQYSPMQMNLFQDYITKFWEHIVSVRNGKSQHNLIISTLFPNEFYRIFKQKN